MIGPREIYYYLTAGGNTKAVTQVLLPGHLLRARGVAVDKIRTTTSHSQAEHSV
jgi:hypothetical protein